MRMRYLLALLVTAALSTYSLAQSGGLINGTRGLPQPNDGTTGTTINLTAKVTPAGNAVIAATTDTTSPVRIVVGGAGTSGNAVLSSTGTLAPCIMDAAVTNGGGDYVIASTTTGGQCHPTPTPPTAGTWVIGWLHDASTTVGSAALVHVNGFIYGGAGGGGGALSALTAATATNTIANGNFQQIWNCAPTGANPCITFGESTANATAASLTNGLLNLNTLSGSLTTPLTINQAGVTTATSVPALQINTTLPNSSAADTALGITITNSGGVTIGSNYFFQFGTGGSALAKMDLGGAFYLSGPIVSNSQSGSFKACGGTTSNCVANVAASLGNAWVQGADNASNNAAAKPGFTLLRAGMLTATTPSASATEEPIQIGAGFLGTASAAFNIVCATATAFTVADCPTAGLNLIGVATSASNPVAVVIEGSVPVNLDNTGVAGDLVCQSSSAVGQGHDNGSTACAAGKAIGVVIAIAGSITTMTGSTTGSQTLTATTPLVLLHFH